MFWIIFIILVVISGIATYYAIRQEKLTNVRLSEQTSRINQLESDLSKRDKEKEEVLNQLKNEFSNKEKEINRQVLELKDKLLQSQDALKKENLNKVTLEKKLQELQAQSAKLNKDLSSATQMYEGLKAQQASHQQLKDEIEKLQQELNNKDLALKAEQASHQELKEKYEALFPPPKAGDPASNLDDGREKTTNP